MEDPRLAGPSSAPTAALEQPVPEVPVPVRLAARRFAEVICPPEIRAGQRADRVLREFGLMLGSLPPAARKALAAALVILDQGARRYPPSRGRRFARLDDQVAGAYIRALLAPPGVVRPADPRGRGRGHRFERGSAGTWRGPAVSVPNGLIGEAGVAGDLG